MKTLSRLLYGIVFIFVAACGNNKTVVPTAQMQRELGYVLEETFKQTLLAANSQASQNSAISLNAVSLAAAAAPTCQTKWGLTWIGIEISFQDSSTCLIGGTITLTVLPLAAKINITSTKLGLVKSLTAEGTLTFANGNFTMQFLDGRISLRNIVNLPWQDLVLNGKMASSWQSSVLSLNARANAFESLSKLGVAVLKKDAWQTCFLSAADPMNPDAGNLTACLGK